MTTHEIRQSERMHQQLDQMAEKIRFPDQDRSIGDVVAYVDGEPMTALELVERFDPALAPRDQT